MNHSPHPFVLEHGYIKSAEGKCLAGLYSNQCKTHDEYCANEALFVAAPDLLAALVSIVEPLLAHYGTSHLIDILGSDRLDTAQAAIAKVRGES